MIKFTGGAGDIVGAIERTREKCMVAAYLSDTLPRDAGSDVWMERIDGILDNIMARYESNIGGCQHENFPYCRIARMVKSGNKDGARVELMLAEISQIERFLFKRGDYVAFVEDGGAMKAGSIGYGFVDRAWESGCGRWYVSGLDSMDHHVNFKSMILLDVPEAMATAMSAAGARKCGECPLKEA